MNDTNSVVNSQWRLWRSSYISGSGSAREIAYQTIREKIINMDYKPGESLSDKRLADELQMSRTPVREALILLTTANMVVLKPQIGTFVAPVDAEWVEMERFFRYCTEKEIILLACDRIDRETAWAFEQNLREYEHYETSGDVLKCRRLLDLDNEFHAIAFRTAGRGRSFFHMMNEMQHFERLRMLSLIELHGEGLLEDHKALAEAVLAGNKKEAVDCLDKHLVRYHEDLKRIREISPEYF